MAVPLNPELQAKLSRLASERGRDTRALAQEAIERFVDYSRNKRSIMAKNVTRTAPKDPPI